MKQKHLGNIYSKYLFLEKELFLELKCQLWRIKISPFQTFTSSRISARFADKHF